VIVVLDTNVWISALQFAKHRGTPTRALEKAMSEDVIASCREIEAEILRVRRGSGSSRRKSQKENGKNNPDRVFVVSASIRSRAVGDEPGAGSREHRPWATKWPMSSLGAMLISNVVGIGISLYRSIQR
jgi:predicted nucleic acid-binding protein